MEGIMRIVLPEELLGHLKTIYGDQGERIKTELQDYADHYQVKKPIAKRADWYKNMRLYCVYPDGVSYDPSLSPLRNLQLHVSQVRDIHCNAMHVLPFLASPMVDKGFDITDYFKIREGLGTHLDLIAFKRAAENENIHVFMDMVLNHVSNEHEWFKKAQAGDERYRNFFIHSKEDPKINQVINKESGVFAEYRVDDQDVEVGVPFSELAGVFPHWEQGADGYWYYHTFYPQEMDLNWFNHEVFIEFGKIIIYWSSFGFNYRFDAIPFVGKAAYKILNNNLVTYQIIAAIRCICDAVHPFSAILIETYEKLPTIIEYFETGPKEAVQLAYNFHLCTKTWASLVKGDVSYIWGILDEEGRTPPMAQWLNFLRNHDELSLDYLSHELTTEVYGELSRFGLAFREGHGVSGRIFSLLGSDPKRLSMAFALLASFPNSLMVYCGDEIAYGNVDLERFSAAERLDTRNISRGTISADDYQTPRAMESRAVIRKIFEKKDELVDFFIKWPKPIEGTPAVFSLFYEDENNMKLLIYINISNRIQRVALDYSHCQPVLTINEADLTTPGAASSLTLGPYGAIWLRQNVGQDPVLAQPPGR